MDYVKSDRLCIQMILLQTILKQQKMQRNSKYQRIHPDHRKDICSDRHYESFNCEN